MLAATPQAEYSAALRAEGESYVGAMALASIGLNVAALVGSVILALVPGNQSFSTALILWCAGVSTFGITVSTISYLFRQRRYEYAVVFLATAETVIIVAVSIIFTGMLHTWIYAASLWGVFLAGLLLGRRAATMMTAWVITLVGVGFWLDAQPFAPHLPSFPEEQIRWAAPISFAVIALIYFLPLVLLGVEGVSHTIAALATETSRAIAGQKTIAQQLEREAELARRVQQASGEVAAMAERDQQAAAEAATGSERLRGELGELAAAANQIAATTRQVTGVASDTALAALRGSEASRAAATRTSELAQELDRTGETISALITSASGIRRALVVIRKVAEDTQILALNAQIEAANAGEAGRRFAVVAGAMSQLAEACAGEAGEIEALTSQIDKAGASARSATHATSEAATAALGLVEEAGKLHRDVTLRAKTQAEAAQAILAAADQQRTAASRAASEVSQVAGQAARAAEAARQMQAVARRLDSAASELAAPTSAGYSRPTIRLATGAKR